MRKNQNLNQKNLILSIESSCDDSSLAITDIDSCTLIYHRKISQESAHNAYGGVVPEIASRLHSQSLPLVLADLREFLAHRFDKQNPFSAVRAVAITTEPGLSVSLLQGLMMAKTLSQSLRVPIISINHLIGHFYSLFIDTKHIKIPMSVLLVSGGHTQILEAHSKQDFRIVATSKDDSFGECFDKVAKMLNLGYPGGCIIEQYALKYKKDFASKCDTQDIDGLSPLPLPLKHSKELAFSFSGLKNATRLLINSFLDSKSAKTSKISRTLNEKNYLSEIEIAHICASFQQVAIAHICDKLTRYFSTKSAQKNPIKTLGIIGGASANLALRSAVFKICERFGAELMLAPLEFCADNAAMIGRAGVEEYKKRNFSDIKSLEISPRNECKILKNMTTNQM